jgi:hypothetical protein
MQNYDWRSALIGPDRIDITPSDPKFRLKAENGNGPALYFIGVMPFAPGFNTMMVSLTLTEASKLLLNEINFIRTCSYLEA